MKDINYINIQGWMVNQLKLSGNELVCYALIYGFSQDGESKCNSSLKYISESINVSRTNTQKLIKRLCEKGLVIKEDKMINGVKFCSYSYNDASVDLSTTGGVDETSTGGVDETSTNNKNIDNNIRDNNIREKNTTKRVFRNSSVYMMSIDEIEEQLKVKGLGIDTNYYFESILDWSDQQDTKTLRTDKGWLATFRTFMRKDKENNRLKMLYEKPNTKSGYTHEDIKDMLDELNF